VAAPRGASGRVGGGGVAVGVRLPLGVDVEQEAAILVWVVEEQPLLLLLESEQVVHPRDCLRVHALDVRADDGGVERGRLDDERARLRPRACNLLLACRRDDLHGIRRPEAHGSDEARERAARLVVAVLGTGV